VATPRFVETGPGLHLSLSGREAALFVLSGSLSGHPAGDLRPGDAVIGPPAGLSGLAASAPATLFIEEREEAGVGGERRIGRGDLGGTGIPGITGIRVLHRSAGGTLLRFGPPPGARWLVTGLRALAVFTGRLLLFEGTEPRSVSAGEWWVVPEPARTLPLQAGNDSAVAVAFGAPDIRVALG
jgi:hypothetical protein